VQEANACRTGEIARWAERQYRLADPVADDGILAPPETRSIVGVHVAQAQALDEQSGEDEQPQLKQDERETETVGQLGVRTAPAADQGHGQADHEDRAKGVKDYFVE